MSKDWSNGLFACFGDCGACLYSFCCPSCAAGEIYEKGDLGSCIVGCLLFCCLAGLLHPCVVTGPLRNNRGINGIYYIIYLHIYIFYIFILQFNIVYKS